MRRFLCYLLLPLECSITLSFLFVLLFSSLSTILDAYLLIVMRCSYSFFFFPITELYWFNNFYVSPFVPNCVIHFLLIFFAVFVFKYLCRTLVDISFFMVFFFYNRCARLIVMNLLFFTHWSFTISSGVLPMGLTILSAVSHGVNVIYSRIYFLSCPHFH